MKTTLPQVRDLFEVLIKSDLSARRKITGIGPRRAEIVIGGAAVFLRAMELFELKSLYYCSAGVRDGIIADLVARRFDLAAIRRIAESPRPLPEVTSDDVEAVPPEVRIAVAQDRAFGFYYQDTIDLLADCGAEILPFSPLDHEALPAGTQGVYLGGGFPELYARELAQNEPMRSALQRHAEGGRPVYAACGGLMALGQRLTDFDGQTLPMFGLLPVHSRMQREVLTIGYRQVEALRGSPVMQRRTYLAHWLKARGYDPDELLAFSDESSNGEDRFASARLTPPRTRSSATGSWSSMTTYSSLPTS